jgi:hypothetical protein
VSSDDFWRLVTGYRLSRLPGGRIIGGAVAGDVGGGTAAGGLTIMPGFDTPIGPVGWPGDVAGLIVIGP